MSSKKSILHPKERKVLTVLGENLKLARLRRKLSTEQVSERANISRGTLWQIEKGSPGVAIGNYVRVLSVMGLAKDLLEVGADDVLGRKLQDIGLITPKRALKSKPGK